MYLYSFLNQSEEKIGKNKYILANIFHNQLLITSNYAHDLKHTIIDIKNIEYFDTKNLNLSYLFKVNGEVEQVDGIMAYPIHPSFLDKLIEKFNTCSDSEDLLQLVVFTDRFLLYAKKDIEFDMYKDKIIKLDGLMRKYTNILRSIKVDFNESMKTVVSSTGFNTSTIPTMYNDLESFISGFFGELLDAEALDVFDDLYEIIETYDFCDENDCELFIQEFSSYIKNKGFLKEVKCLEHILKENNDTNVANDIHMTFGYFVTSEKYQNIVKRKNKGLSNEE